MPCFIYYTEGANGHSQLILQVDPPSGRSAKDEVLHNNYASIPITVAENVSSKCELRLHMNSKVVYMKREWRNVLNVMF